jgi:hypothetical protein
MNSRKAKCSRPVAMRPEAPRRVLPMHPRLTLFLVLAGCWGADGA